MNRAFLRAAAVAALCAFGALLPAPGAAQSWAELSKKLHADCDAFSKNVADLTMTMETSIPSSAGSMTTTGTLYRKGDRFRMEATIGSMGDASVDSALAGLTTIVISDGADAWIVAPMAGASKISLDEGLKYRGQWTCEDFIPVDAEIVGSEKIGDRMCYVLAVIDPRATAGKLWIDQKSGVLVKLEGKPSEGETMSAVFSEFEPVAGLGEIAHRTDMYSGSDLISTTIVSSIEVNKGLSDDLFDVAKVKVEGGAMGDALKKMLQAGDKQRDE